MRMAAIEAVRVRAAPSASLVKQEDFACIGSDDRTADVIAAR